MGCVMHGALSGVRCSVAGVCVIQAAPDANGVQGPWDVWRRDAMVAHTTA